MVKVRRQNSNWKPFKQRAKKNGTSELLCQIVAPVVPPRNHGRSRERFKIFIISRNHFLCDLPQKMYYARSNSRPFRSLEFLTPGTMTQYRPRRRHRRLFCHFRPSVWPCSCSKFDLGPSPSNSAKKSLQDRRLLFWSAVFLLTKKVEKQDKPFPEFPKEEKAISIMINNCSCFGQSFFFSLFFWWHHRYWSGKMRLSSRIEKSWYFSSQLNFNTLRQVSLDQKADQRLCNLKKNPDLVG